MFENDHRGTEDAQSEQSKNGQLEFLHSDCFLCASSVPLCLCGHSLARSMKIGICLESLGLPLKRALHEAARLGVAGVQMDAVGDLAPERLGQTGRREFRTRLRSLNLELTAVGCPLRRGLDVAEDLQPRLEQVRKVMT